MIFPRKLQSHKKIISHDALSSFRSSLLYSINILRTPCYQFQISQSHPVIFKTVIIYSLFSGLCSSVSPRVYFLNFRKIFSNSCSWSCLFKISKKSSASHVHKFALHLMREGGEVAAQMIRIKEQWEKKKLGAFWIYFVFVN